MQILLFVKFCYLLSIKFVNISWKGPTSIDFAPFFRISLAEEGCARILNFRNSGFILSQLIKSLGIDKEG